MATDYSHANLDAIDEMGFLTQWEKDHGEDAGWARSVIEKITADKADAPRVGDSWDRDDYSADELAMYDWYWDKFYDGKSYSDWKAITDQYAKEHQDQITYTKPEDYKDKTDLESDDNVWKPPAVSEWKGDVSKNNQMVVNTEAIQHLINQFKAVATEEHKGMLLDLANELDGHLILPGGFAKAEILRQKIDGTGEGNPGLRGDTIGLLRTLHRALYDLQTGLATMKTEYEKTEEDNKVTQDKLQEAMKGAWGEIGGLSKYGTVGGSTKA
ncbi:hypothetical protein [Actinoplanes sp. RD1]|uniref:hypothetical protein n=1 Tax=Actinoplanes sp. RD1 TaxID=3064538 RepID=UPI0027404C1A|nr:hypothetical protein [Actinoplanes sp. RD1]